MEVEEEEVGRRVDERLEEEERKGRGSTEEEGDIRINDVGEADKEGEGIQVEVKDGGDGLGKKVEEVERLANGKVVS